ncbi:c-type cytochrome [Foetidibacter luteolus]|uniref:c-type cytochrome n=1 Tax=Foetidibacter luteolus TaxID=2608880 RepID=UPI00129AA376|nr:cytochrome c [Foetidibacter luteolus]
MFKKGLVTLTALFIVLATASAQAPSKAVLAKGKEIYTQYCLTCHQPDGEGVPNLNPPLIKTAITIGEKTKLITWVLSGTTEKKEIDGVFYGNNMPPQNYLKDDEIAAVLTYIRSSFGNKSSAVSATDVKKVRASVK